jgi:hypothetical protein
MSQGDPAPVMRNSRAGNHLLYQTGSGVLLSTSHIDALPNELLRECLESAMGRSVPLTPHTITFTDTDNANADPQRQAYTSARSISLTCKRFRAVMMPILYSHVHIVPPHRRKPQAWDKTVPMRFVRTMNTSPAVRDHIECLGISMQSFSRISTPPGLDEYVFTRLSKVSLAVTHIWPTRQWKLCCANLRNLPALSELHVDLQKRCQGDFRPFYRILGQLPNLLMLTLVGVCSERYFTEEFELGSDAPDFGLEGGTLSQVCQSQ